jgi:hypothetical protein
MHDSVASRIAGGRVCGIGYRYLWEEMMDMSTAAATTEPLIPMSFGIWGLLMILGVALFIGALISIARNRIYTSGGTVVWALIVLALPLLGPLLWFLIGRRAAPESPTNSTNETTRPRRSDIR